MKFKFIYLECGKEPVIDITNQKLIESLKVGDVVMANDFPTTISSVTGTSQGWSGEGWTKVPWLGDTRIRVTYAGIKVNSDYKLIDGAFITTYNPKGKNIGDVDQTVADVIESLNSISDLITNNNNFITESENKPITNQEIDSMKTYTFTLIDKVWQTADESTKKLLDSARNDYKEMFDCYKEQAEGTTTTPSQERGGPSPETPSQQNCAQYGVKAAKTMNQVQDVTASKTKPNPGDPLVNMLVQGTDPNNPNNRIGGTYGCVRHTPTQKKQNCSNWEKNIINFPHITGKNKVHDGVDLTASTRTPVYAMFDGMAVTGFSSDLGNYVRIHSSSKEHKLHFESNTIWTSYAHLDSYINQINGKFVKQGDLIGYSGNSGKIAEKIDKWQYHLHVTIYQGSQDKYHRINPINYFTSKFDNNGNKIK